jgi:hypothetical protein
MSWYWDMWNTWAKDLYHLYEGVMQPCEGSILAKCLLTLWWWLVMFRGLGLSHHHSLCDTLVTGDHLCPTKLWKRDRNSTKRKKIIQGETLSTRLNHMLAFYPTISKHLFKLSYLTFNFSTSIKFVMQIFVWQNNLVLLHVWVYDKSWVVEDY